MAEFSYPEEVIRANNKAHAELRERAERAEAMLERAKALLNNVVPLAAQNEALLARYRVTLGEPLSDIPQAWADLIKALVMLARAQTDDISPLWCKHDELNVCATAEKFTPEEIALLDELGFHVNSDEDGFYSFRFGSA